MSNNSDDPVWILVIFIGILILMAWGVWELFRTELLEGMRYLRLIELAPLTLFDEQARSCFSWLRQAPIGDGLPSDEVIYASADCFGVTFLRQVPSAEAINYYSLTPTSVGFVTRLVADYLKWLLALLCAWGIYKALFVSQKDGFKTVYTLEGFIKKQAEIWPVIKPIVQFIPSKCSARIPGTIIPEKLPLFAEALSPEEWLSFHQISVKGGIPDREKTRQAFRKQLGPQWKGYEGLPPYMLGALAAFALKGVQKRDESDEFLGKLSLYWSEKGGFKPSSELMSEINKILKDPAIGGKALEVASKHAYQTTAILAVLQWGRFMGGVLASAQFLWLRGTDRNLWYALNNLGRRSFHMEGAGAMAHFMAEELAQKALPIPRLETAIVALNQYIAANQPIIPPYEGAKAQG